VVEADNAAEVELGATDVTVISVVGQIGALIGGTTLGYSSTFVGRRLTMITGCFIGAALVPAYIIPRSMTLVASAFFLQFCVGGVWGVIPIHLTELAPPALRTTAVGLTYQLGNLASSASATIQSVIGEKYPLPPHDGEKRFNYGKVIGIFMGAIWAGQIFFLFLGPEMSEEERAEYAASADDLENLRKQGVSLKDIGIQRAKTNQEGEDSQDTSGQEKPVDIEHVEREEPKEAI
jgi:MFS transporter, SHS family, lactate transporter